MMNILASKSKCSVEWITVIPAKPAIRMAKGFVIPTKATVNSLKSFSIPLRAAIHLFQICVIPAKSAIRMAKGFVIPAKAGIQIAKFVSALMLLASLGACSTLSTDSSQTAEALKDSRDVYALLSRAMKAYEGNDVANADLLFQELMTYEPRSPESLNSYAIFLREQWRFEEAEKLYLRALRYSPNNTMSHWNIAVLYDLYLGQPDKALQHYQAYQQFAEEPDRRIHSWLVDLQHRIKLQAEDDKVVEVAGND